MNDPRKVGTGLGTDNARERTTPVISHHDTIEWFEAIPGELLCIRVHGTQVNSRYAIMENVAAPGTATPMHFHAEDEIFHVLEGTVTFSINGDVFNASVGLNCGDSSRRTSRVEKSFEHSGPHVDYLFARWCRRPLPQAREPVATRARSCS